MRMKPLIVMICLLAVQVLQAQPYRPEWESLDKRPVPQWFQDAKFGIFIHWGVYAVPGWSPKGNYAEWYQQGLQTTDTARQRYHQSKFGNRSYYELAGDFKAELYNPDEWAKLFAHSGARYIVLTSKHHDGFALWPSREASSSWGFPWNAAEVGPKRDLLGDLFTAVRKTPVRAGMYYSLYEWFHPLWKKDPAAFARQHTWPQMKDLIARYEPDVFWTDGDWDAPAETWRSQEFLAWLYNESPVKDKVVVNDRWGSGVRFKHGGIYTPEYQPDLDFEDHYWEESRGMGHSYGYNREEDAWDYNSTQSLIIALVDKVSRGGNFLLDIGPDEHGKIPPIMQERLLQIGDWLSVHGEAIYGTRRWKTPVQWSAGLRDYQLPHRVAGDWSTHQDLMLKLTVDPDPGFAVKEVFYTYNDKQNDLYAVFPKYPASGELVLKEVQLPAGTVVSFLSLQGQSLAWKQRGADVVVALPPYDPNSYKAPFAYVVKIAGFGKYAARPQLQVAYKPGSLKPTVSFTPEPGTEVHYTLDGSAPDRASPRYTQEWTLDQTAVVKARAFSPDGFSSGLVAQEIKVYTWKTPLTSGRGLQPGLRVQLYELNPQRTSDLDAVAPLKSVTATKVDTRPATRQEHIGLRFDGFIKVDADALYQFYLASDDGSRLWIDGEEVINHDGLHGNDEKTGSIALKKGFHAIRVDYIQAAGGIDLKLQYRSTLLKKQEIPASAFYMK